MEVVPTPQWVNYVETYPMFLVSDASEPLTIFSAYFKLDLVIHMVYSMGEF